MTPITEIEKYFEENEIKSTSFKLNACATIVDPKLFVSNHLSILKTSRDSEKKRIFLPYYNRLTKFYKHEKSLSK